MIILIIIFNRAPVVPRAGATSISFRASVLPINWAIPLCTGTSAIASGTPTVIRAIAFGDLPPLFQWRTILFGRGAPVPSFGRRRTPLRLGAPAVFRTPRPLTLNIALSPWRRLGSTVTSAPAVASTSASATAHW
eukprot:TRINITY_DN8411_c0_g1_i1.p2 TRINITY_DN8411_c0_g1~~TRINITY_DN8411_c0_g1_i1.p2  ORF type:complete len:135 (-),score=20.56 TRINITY_DN8411_c0_g1_i1:995-1399(-)